MDAPVTWLVCMGQEVDATMCLWKVLPCASKPWDEAFPSFPTYYLAVTYKPYGEASSIVPNVLPSYHLPR